MKYLVRWEVISTMKEAVERSQVFKAEKEKNPDKYPKVLFQGGIIPATGPVIKGFETVESTEEQMLNDVMFWMEHSSFEFIPFLESPKIGPMLQAKFGLGQ